MELTQPGPMPCGLLAVPSTITDASSLLKTQLRALEIRGLSTSLGTPSLTRAPSGAVLSPGQPSDKAWGHQGGTRTQSHYPTVFIPQISWGEGKERGSPLPTPDIHSCAWAAGTVTVTASLPWLCHMANRMRKATIRQKSPMASERAKPRMA